MARSKRSGSQNTRAPPVRGACGPLSGRPQQFKKRNRRKRRATHGCGAGSEGPLPEMSSGTLTCQSMVASVSSINSLPPNFKGVSKSMLSDLFISQRHVQNCYMLLEYIKGEEMIESIVVPGYKKFIASNDIGKYLKPTDLTLGLIDSIIVWISDLHSLGWSFDGQFNALDLYITSLGVVKASCETKKLLKKSTFKRNRRDMDSLADLIEYELLSRESDLPSDTKHLLCLLRHYRERYRDLIVDHPANKNEVQKLALFGSLYLRLDQLHLAEPAKYKRIIKKMPYCKLGKNHWKKKVMRHSYLLRILQYKSSLAAAARGRVMSIGGAQGRGRAGGGGRRGGFLGGRGGGRQGRGGPVSGGVQGRGRGKCGLPVAVGGGGDSYSSNGSGLLKFHRNTVQHLLNPHSVKLKGKRTILFEYRQIEHMLSHAFPKVICKFQKAMHAENEFVPLMLSGKKLRRMMIKNSSK